MNDSIGILGRQLGLANGGDVRQSMGNCIKILALGILDHIVPLQLPCLLRREVFLHKGLKQLHTIDHAAVAEPIGNRELGLRVWGDCRGAAPAGPDVEVPGAPAVC